MHPKLKDLRKKRAALAAEFKSIVAREADDAALPEADVSRLSAIEGEIAAIDERVKRIEAAIALEGESAEPVAGEPGEGKGYTLDADGRMTPHGYGEKQSKAAEAADRLQGKGFRMARFAFGLVHAKGGSGLAGAAAFVERRFGDKAVAKALASTAVSSGGALIPQDFSSEFIELLRAETVVRRCGPTVLPMPLGNLTVPRMAGGASAGYQGELDDIQASQETFDDIQLNAKKLTTLVPVSNDLIRRAPVGVEGIVRDDMVQTAARREDLAFLLGDGSRGSPIGLIVQAPASSKILVPAFAAADNATVLGAVGSVLQGLQLMLQNNMSRMLRPSWISTFTVKAFLSNLRDGVGNYVFKDELAGGKLLGIPFVCTQQLPDNLNTATSGASVNNGSYLALVDFADVILADTMNVSVDASDVASYLDGNGNAVSTFTRDQTAFRLIQEHDLALRHFASVAVAIVPGWAPAGYTVGGGASFFAQPLSTDRSAAPSVWGTQAPTGSNLPGHNADVAPGGTQPGIA